MSGNLELSQSQFGRAVGLFAGSLFAVFALAAFVFAFIAVEYRWLFLALGAISSVKAALGLLLFVRTASPIRSNTLLLRNEWRSLAVGYALTAPLFLMSAAARESFLGWFAAPVCIAVFLSFWLASNRASIGAA